MFNFQPRPFFTAQTGAEKAPAVNFNFGSSPAATPSRRHPVTSLVAGGADPGRLGVQFELIR